MNASGDRRAERRPRCPCGFGEAYDECCGRVHAGDTRAATAEALMRSRYSAFAVGDTAYLLRSWHPRTRPAMRSLDSEVTWERLEIVATSDGGPLHTEGTVEFRAHYRTAEGQRGQQHEVSRFLRHDGQWTYLDGELS